MPRSGWPERVGFASPSAALQAGLLAVGLLLLTELTVVLRLRKLTISEDLAGRDPLAGTVYLLLLGVFALMPLLVVRR